MIRHRIAFSVALALSILVTAAALKYAQGLEVIGSDFARRAMQVMIGLVLAGYGNVMPKEIGQWRASAAAARRSQSALRVGGWSMTLAGLTYAGLWAFAPMAVADVAATSVVAFATVLMAAYAARTFFLCRRNRAGHGEAVTSEAVILDLEN
jgi:hypothetical protein